MIIPFTLLEVHHSMRNKTPMSGTGDSSDACDSQSVPIGISLVDRSVRVAG